MSGVVVKQFLDLFRSILLFYSLFASLFFPKQNYALGAQILVPPFGLVLVDQDISGNTFLILGALETGSISSLPWKRGRVSGG